MIFAGKMPALPEKTSRSPIPKTVYRLKTLLVACALLFGALRVARADAAPAPQPPQSPAPQSQSPQTQPQAEDLGEGLSYFRVTQLASQLPNIRDALEKHPALVLDLRGATGSNAAAQAFRAALADASASALASVPTPASTSASETETASAPASAKPGARVARFVLINVATAPAIPFTLGGGPAGNGVPGVLVIAPAPAGVFADVKAPCSDDDDKRACEAIAQGAPPRTLINRQPDKPRNDEAALMREQTGKPQQTAAADANAAALDATAADAATPNAAAPDADAPNSISAAPSSVPSFASPSASSAPSAASPDAPPPAPPTDSVLQLAVQIHRSLLALKKLQAL